MLAVVVPAQNESGRIGIVLKNLLLSPFDIIIPVVNGCTDSTLDEVLAVGEPRIKPIYFVESLGIDVPRAIGSLFALEQRAEGIVFVDGDMTGDFQSHLACIIHALNTGVDLALVNCYPYITNRQQLASMVLHFRGKLNRELGIFRYLGLASPAHGPHGISGRLARAIDPIDFSIPPMVLVKAKQLNYTIKVVASIPHLLLSSPVRERGHARRVAHTIIGDCLQALSYVNNKLLARNYGKHVFDGYNPVRRLDILAEWQTNLQMGNHDYLKSHLL